MRTPILGSSYVARSVNAAASRMVNLFPEIIAEGGREPAFLNRCPGLTLLATVGTGPIRGMWAFNGYLFVVSGDALYKVDSTYTATNLGFVSNLTGAPVSMADDGIVLFVVSDTLGYTYYSSVSTYNPDTFVKITDPAFPGAVSVTYLDVRFFFNQPNTQVVWTSNIPVPGQPISFDASLIYSAEGSPDNVVGVITDHRELWVFGTNSTEVWYDAGNPGFPLQPIEGAFSEIGCASASTIAKLDNAVFWLSSDARGQGIVYRAVGYSGERISTHAVEWQIQQYGDLSTASAYTYQQDGHAFYVLIFPGQDTTWVYDVSTGAWHERCAFDNGAFTRHRGNCQAHFNNINIVGDYDNGNLYSLDLTNYSDNGASQKWLRSWRAMPPEANRRMQETMQGTSWDDLKRKVHHSLQLDCETGVGLNAGQGSDPQVMLRWSDDGGHTWSNERPASMGAIGNYSARVIWRRLGATEKLRDRVYEVSGTDPVKIAIIGAELNAVSTIA